VTEEGRCKTWVKFEDLPEKKNHGADDVLQKVLDASWCRTAGTTFTWTPWRIVARASEVNFDGVCTGIKGTSAHVWIWALAFKFACARTFTVFAAWHRWWWHVRASASKANRSSWAFTVVARRSEWRIVHWMLCRGWRWWQVHHQALSAIVDLSLIGTLVDHFGSNT
jgi:hypothetical protein